MNKIITILSFSSRINGNCNAIAKVISNYYRTNVHSYAIASKRFTPCGDCNYECLKSGACCPNLTPEQRAVMDRIRSSDMVYFIVPNYCGFPCANYFAFNERSVGYFGRNKELLNQYLNVPKRFIIVSNTEGFEKAMQQQTNDTPVCLYLKSHKYGKQSVDGDLMESDAAKADLMKFIEETGMNT